MTDTMRLAKAVHDNWLDIDTQYNECTDTFSCLFCTSNVVVLPDSAKVDERKNVRADIAHQHDCPVLLAEKIISNNS